MFPPQRKWDQRCRLPPFTPQTWSMWVRERFSTRGRPTSCCGATRCLPDWWDLNVTPNLCLTAAKVNTAVFVHCFGWPVNTSSVRGNTRGLPIYVYLCIFIFICFWDVVPESSKRHAAPESTKSQPAVFALRGWFSLCMWGHTGSSSSASGPSQRRNQIQTGAASELLWRLTCGTPGVSLFPCLSLQFVTRVLVGFACAKIIIIKGQGSNMVSSVNSRCCDVFNLRSLCHTCKTVCVPFFHCIHVSDDSS